MKSLVYCDKKVKSLDGENGLIEYVLEDQTKLSEVFSALPPGIVNKTETGIGATTLELHAKRNSIIVEPIKVTAYSKAAKRISFLQQNPDTAFASPGAIYVGSELGHHSKKLTLLDIKKYHESPGYKKILVVADSLPKVIKAIGPDVYQDYFIMIDEADAFQLDSTFRDSMNICLDHFKAFPESNRALVTATMLEFSDPDIDRVPKTLIRYARPTTYNIRLVHSDDNLEGAAVEVIERITSSKPGEKMLVAYNSPAGCYNIATHLEKHGQVKKGEQRIMCSQASKGVVKHFFTELTGDTLPARVNYITSAYFSGFDLHEDFHLVIITDGGSPILALSEHKIKQIAGRCRQTLLSLTVNFRTSPHHDKIYSKEELIDAGDQEVKSLKCFSQRFSQNRVLSSNMSKLRKVLMDNDSGIRFTRWTENSEPAIAYLNIDARLESQRVRSEIYGSTGQLQQVLMAIGHNVSVTNNTSQTPVADQQSKSEDIYNQVQEVMCEVRKLQHHSHVNQLYHERSWTERQKKVLQVLNEYYPYVEWDDLKDRVEKVYRKLDKRALKTFEAKLFFSTYGQNTTYKKELSKFFVPGNTYTEEEQLQLWQKFLRTLDPTIPLPSKYKATKLTHMHFKVKPAKRGNQPEIISDNPLGIRIKRRRDDQEKSFQELLNLLF